MLGTIIGDVVGSIYEPRHHHIKTKDFLLFSSNSHVTDDTVMSCAVAEALYSYKQTKKINLFKVELVNSMRKFGNAYPHAGYGRAFKKWLQENHPKPYGSYGNGSAMRVSPVAYVADCLQEAEELAKASAEVTHNHPEGIKGAQAVVSCIFLARKGKNKQKIKSYIESNYYKLDFSLDEIRPHYKFDVSCQGSVPQAIVAFLESSNFEDAIRNAISIGGDSDTIAAIAGGIAEAYYGIPDHLKHEGLKYVSEGLICDAYKHFIHYCPAYSEIYSMNTKACETRSKELVEDADKDLLNAFRGSLVGGAVGDALGYAVEFMSLDAIRSTYGENGITHYHLNQGKALISDDTQMTLFTANGLLLGITRGMTRGIMGDIEDYVYGCYKDWLATQYGTNIDFNYSWLFHVRELHSTRAPGNTCLNALQSGDMGTLEKPINHSKGCGGVMRVAPVGLYCPRRWDRTETVLIGAKVAAITHGHPLGFIPAAALSDIISQIVYGESADLKEIVRESTRFIVSVFKQYSKVEDFERIMELAVSLSEQDIEEDQAIKQLGEGWVAEEALAIAVYCCLKHSNDFAAAVVAAVNHDGDSDSTGAITGNIIGSFLGYTAIPNKFLERLELKDIIIEIAEDLYHDCKISEYAPLSSQSEFEWEAKYINCQSIH